MSKTRRDFSKEFKSKVVLEALKNHSKPEIHNSDQGLQFTSLIFTKTLLNNKIITPTNEKERARDTIFIERLWRTLKNKNIYLKSYENGISLYSSLVEYFEFYNFECQHQSLKYSIPIEVFKLV